MTCPDWTDPDSYAYLNNLNASGFAFEFLRRSSKYQDAYAQWRNIVKLRREKYGDSPLFKLFDPLLWIFEPEKHASENVLQWATRVREEGHEPRKTWYSDYFPAQFGMQPPLLDPAYPADREVAVLPWNAPILPDASSVLDYFAGDDSDTMFVRPQGQIIGFGTVVFDLRKPLPPQLRIAKAQLIERQNEETELHFYNIEKSRVRGSRKWLGELLRVFDARIAGATDSEIANVVLRDKPNEAADGYYATKKVYDLALIAQRLVCSDYRYVAGMPLNSD